ncbi:ribonuclease H-like domain-containing protein [Tanacetum coccineum]
MYHQGGNFYVYGNNAYMLNAFQSQATMLLQAFQTTTPHDSSWNMDSGASSHLADNTGKHVKLPFYNFESSVKSVFEIIHSDIWTSPIPSESEIKYYAIFLEHYSHFVWVYPLHKKSDLFDNFVAFRAYVNKQFDVDIKVLQCDHGGEYDNTRFHVLFRQNGIQFRFSCPRTSQQNGKSEHNSSQTVSTRPMVPRAKSGIFRPLKHMNCHVTTTSPLPRSHVRALRDPNGKEAMLDEYNALITNGTWVLVPCPSNVNVVRSMWLFDAVVV